MDYFHQSGYRSQLRGGLIENVVGLVDLFSPPVEGIVYSFDYTVPDVAVGSEWGIFARCTNCIPEAGPHPLELTMVPEPTTIALLGLGGLLLRRSRK